MNWINDTFGTEFSTEIQLGIIFVALLVALLIIIWLFRRIFGSARSRIARSRQPRLGVVEAAIVDDTRRLVLVRRDNVEHLLMIGGPGDVVVENNIRKEPAAQAQTPKQQTSAQRMAASGHETPETTPREPRLIEPVTDSSPEVAAPQQKHRNITPPAETPAVAATGAAAAAGFIASETAEAAGEIKAVVEEPAIEAQSVDTETQDADTAAAAEELAQELTGNLSVAADELVADAEGSVSPEVRDGDGATDTEEDMQKLLDELAGEKN